MLPTINFDFAAVLDYTPVLLKGIGITLALTMVGSVGGFILGIAGAWWRFSGGPAVRWLLQAYVTTMRNTPFLIQVFFLYFGLPSLGVRLSGYEASLLAIVIKLGAYNCELLRAGIEATPRGQLEAAACLAMNKMQTFTHVVLAPALKRVWPAITSQVVLIMLDTAVCSQISAEELTFAANFVQSRNFRSFETYLIVTGIYFVLAFSLRRLLLSASRPMFYSGGVRHG